MPLPVRQKKSLDFYLGTALLILIGAVRSLMSGFRSPPYATPRIKGSACVCKLQGGGNFLIALPALLGLRKSYPDVRLVALTTRSVAPFAELLNVFDQVLVVDDRSLFTLCVSTAKALRSLWKIDTFIDLEVTSRLSAAFGVFTAARQRLSFYVEDVSLKRKVCTGLVFFNRTQRRTLFFDNMVRAVHAEPVPVSEAISFFRGLVAGAMKSPAPQSPYLVIAPGCSSLSYERKLSIAQWCSMLGSQLPPEVRTVCFIGGADDAPLADAILASVPQELKQRCVMENHSGKCSLHGSLSLIKGASRFWGIDSAMLHAARLLGVPSVSFWGPTDPELLLLPIEGYEEDIRYRPILCSPCVHLSEAPPCGGNNLCMQQFFSEESISAEEFQKNVIWRASGEV